jgi:hypothetical protein
VGRADAVFLATATKAFFPASHEGVRLAVFAKNVTLTEEVSR